MIDRWALHDLYAKAAAALDEERWDDWLALFTQDARYIVQPRENHDAGLPLATMRLLSRAALHDRVYGVTQTMFHQPYYQRHLVSGVRPLGHEGAFTRATSNYLVIRTKTGEPSEVFNAGRTLDLIATTPEGPRFAERLIVFDSELVPNSIVYPL